MLSSSSTYTDPQVTDSQAPEIRASELCGPGRMSVDREGQDRPTQSSGVTGRQPAKLTLRGR